MDTGIIQLLRGWAFRANRFGAKGALLPSQNESFTDKDASEEAMWSKYLFDYTQNIEVGFFQNENTFYSHTISNEDPQVLDASFFQNTNTFYSHTISVEGANPIIGYGKNSGGYSPSACFGVVPDIPLYHHPSENAQAGMLLVGKILYTDAAGTTPVAGTAATSWSFNRDGNAADRSMSVADNGEILNIAFRNGVVFGYSKESGDCNTTSFDLSIYNAPDDYQQWYPRKAFARTNDGGFFLVNTHALAYSPTGPAIGTASMIQVNSYQNTYTSMAACAVSTARGYAFFWE